VNSKARTWLAGGAAAMLLVLAAGYVLLVSPKKSQTRDVRTQQTAVLADNARLQAQINQLLAQKKEITAKQIRLAEIGKRIPGDAQLPATIRRLTQAARTAAVDMVSFTPGTPTPAASYYATAAPYNQIGVTLEIRGTYAALEEWFRQIEDPALRLIVVEKVNLTPKPPGVGDGSVTIGPGGIPETIRTITAAVTGRMFSTAPATIVADLPALNGVGAVRPPAGGTAASTTAPKPATKP
jgi:Tfp pilus assembly protein PilO